MSPVTVRRGPVIIKKGPITWSRGTRTYARVYGQVSLWGRARPLRTPVAVRAVTGRVRITGSVLPVRPIPYGAFRDFAHYAETQTDPAKVLYTAAGKGLAVWDDAAPSNMRRVWLTASGPSEYRVSNGQVLWPRAAFVGVGTRVNAMAANEYMYVDGAQVELTSQGSVAGPSAYVPARALKIVVHADRMNYVKNPQTPVALTANVQERPLSTIGGKYYAASVTVSGDPGAVFEVYVRDGANRIAEYSPGKIDASGKVRISVPAIGRSVSNTCYLGMKSFSGSVTFEQPRVDRVTGVGPLPVLDALDGSLGTDYLWGGAANNSEAYYYHDRQTRAYLLQKILRENGPLGVVPGVPQFAVLPTE